MHHGVFRHGSITMVSFTRIFHHVFCRGVLHHGAFHHTGAAHHSGEKRRRRVSICKPRYISVHQGAFHNDAFHHGVFHHTRKIITVDRRGRGGFVFASHVKSANHRGGGSAHHYWATVKRVCANLHIRFSQYSQNMTNILQSASHILKTNAFCSVWKV